EAGATQANRPARTVDVGDAIDARPSVLRRRAGHVPATPPTSDTGREAEPPRRWNPTSKPDLRAAGGLGCENDARDEALTFLAHRFSNQRGRGQRSGPTPDERHEARHIGISVLVLSTQNAGSVLGLTAWCRVVLCGSGASTASPERAICADATHIESRDSERRIKRREDNARDCVSRSARCRWRFLAPHRYRRFPGEVALGECRTRLGRSTISGRHSIRGHT